MIHVRVRLFAVLRDRADGAGEVALALPDGATAADASAALLERFPALHAHLRTVAYAVNQAYAPAATVLRDGDEVALIPPVSGG